MQYEATELSVTDGELRSRPTRRRRMQPAETAPDPGLEFWSRLFVLQQTTVLIAKLLRRPKTGGASRQPDAAEGERGAAQPDSRTAS